MPKAPAKRGRNKLPSSQKKRRTGSTTLCIALGLVVVLLACIYINLLSFQNLPKSVNYSSKKDILSSPIISTKDRVLEKKSITVIVPKNKPANDVNPATNPAAPAPDSKLTTTISTFSSAHCQGSSVDEATVQSSKPVELKASIFPTSVRLRGNGLAQVYIGGFTSDDYKGTVMEVEGCVDFYHLYKDEAKKAHFIVHAAVNTDKVLTAKRQVLPELQEKFATTKDLSQPHTRIVFSATSSQYFGYQTLANALGFLRSNQTNASWLRLLSASQVDDLSERFPTFAAPKSLYQVFYQPINKADIIDKWFHSKDAPHPDDTIVVIDPDNWLTNSLQAWTTSVSPKLALGQRAYYSGNKAFQELWKDICLAHCDVEVDPAGVPYLLKASDLKDVAPLWREYSIIIKESFLDNATFAGYYGPNLGVKWAAEMFGYNAACAHLQIKTQIVSDMQIRDVDGGKREWERLQKNMPMIHMGRAWFPKENPEAAAPWRHKLSNEPGDIAATGIQVWCKCNNTAPFVQPWPLPKEGMDWVSYQTLTLLHDSVVEFGPVPHNESYRRIKPNFYQHAVP